MTLGEVGYKMALIPCLDSNEMVSSHNRNKRHKPHLSSFGCDFCINQQRALLLAENNFVYGNFRPEREPFLKFLVLVRQKLNSSPCLLSNNVKETVNLELPSDGTSYLIHLIPNNGMISCYFILFLTFFHHNLPNIIIFHFMEIYFMVNFSNKIVF